MSLINVVIDAYKGNTQSILVSRLYWSIQSPKNHFTLYIKI